MGPYFTEQEEQFRTGVRAWLRQNLDETVRVERTEPAPENEAEWVAIQREWDRRLFRGGYAGLAWPVEYGGRGATVIEQVIYAEEAARAGAPIGLNFLGRHLIAPPIMRHGTDDQKQRHLPAMLRGEEIWCQGFSEPDAGSDLASLKTAAVLEGERYVVNGQKIWTSGAHHSDWMLLLARTNPHVPKHKGLTAFLVDLRTPGIEIRPIRQLSGASGFNEVFLSDVRVPAQNVLGPLDDGWDVAMTTLGHERSTLNAGGYLTNLRLLREAIAAQGGDLQTDTPRSVQLLESLGRAYGASRALGYAQARQVSRWAAGARPGPESSALRLAWALAFQQATSWIIDLLGPEGFIPSGPHAIAEGDWLYTFYEARSRSIAAGTAEIQRNVLAERVLGLPR